MGPLKRWLWPLGLYTVLSAALMFPVLSHFTSSIPHDAGDPVLNAWILWWNTRQLPLTAAWWNAPMFFPMRGAFALSEVLLGLLPITAPVQWLTDSPLVAYNTAFVLSFPLCALAAYALAVEITGRRDAALLCGIAFAFAPYRMGQLAHLQSLAYYGAPVVLLALHRFVRTLDRRWLALFGVAWLVQSLSNGYALFHLGLLIAFWIIWFARRLSVALPILGTWLLASLPLAPLLLGYQSVHTSLHLTRDINEIKRFGIDLGDLLTVPPEVMLWGSRLWPSRPETAVFPGATMIAVAALWIGAAWWERRAARVERTLDQRVLIWIAAGAALVALSALTIGPWKIGPLTVTEFRKPFSIAVAARLLALVRGAPLRRAWSVRSPTAFYVVAMVGLYVLALGPEPRLFGRPYLYQPPYAWLMELPGFATLRVPARFAMLAVLCQAVLFACAVSRWRIASASTRSLVFAGLGFGLLVDGWTRVPVVPVPVDGPRATNVAAVFEVPGDVDEDFAAIYRATRHGVPIVNGYSGYFPPHYLPLVYAMHHREYAVLHDLADQPLGVAVNRAIPGAAELQAALSGLDGVVTGAVDPDWALFTVAPRRLATPAVGPRLALAAVEANRQPQDAGRMTDGRVDTAWGSPANQIGDEEIVVDLGAAQPIAAVVLAMGSYAFGFPRELAIDVSPDRSAWTTAWTGETSVATVRAAVQDPSRVPVTIALGRVSARFVRLRQTGSEPGIPWWIAELTIHAPLP